MFDRPDTIDHVLFLILAVVLGPRAFVTFRALRSATPEQLLTRRPRAFRAAMISQWVLSAALIAHWIWRARTWTSLGLTPRATPGAAGIAIGLVAMVAILMFQSRRVRDRGEALARTRQRLGHVEFILPHSPSELRLFTALSITAGVCEELLFRGFMIWYLAHWTGIIQAALISSLIFGIGHAYQGVRGILLTGGIGVFFSGAYLVSGSLYLPMLIHAMVDISSGRAGYEALAAAGDATGRDAAAPAGPTDASPPSSTGA